MAESAQIQTASSNSVPPGTSRGLLEAELKSERVDPNFILNDTSTFGERPCVVLNNKEHVVRISSKLSISYQAKLYGRIEVTAKRPYVYRQDNYTWQQTFKQELRFLSDQQCHWHNHPNIVQYHGIAILEEEGECVPYLLLEHVEWNLCSLLEDKDVKLSQKHQVFIVHDIASGLNFLHSRKPRAIVHAALVTSSVLLNKRGHAKLSNFFHAGFVDGSLTIKSLHHTPSLNPNHDPCRDGTKLQTSLDMSSLGSIIKKIDTKHKNRERVKGNILKDLYVLYDCEDGPPQELSAGEVYRKLVAYLETPRQEQHRDSQQKAQGLGQQLSVSA